MQAKKEIWMVFYEVGQQMMPSIARFMEIIGAIIAETQLTGGSQGGSALAARIGHGFENALVRPKAVQLIPYPFEFLKP